MTEDDSAGGGNGNLFGDWISGAFGDALENLANAVLEGVGAATASVASVWVLIGTPNLTSTGGTDPLIKAGASDPASGELVRIMNWIAGIGLVVAVISLIWLAMMVAASMRRGEGMLNVGRGGLILTGAVIIGSAGAIAGTLMPNGPNNAAGATLFLQSSLWWYTAAIAGISVIIGGIRMAWEARAEPGRDLVKSLLTLLVVAGGGVTATQALITLADSFSVWILQAAINCDVSNRNSDCFGENMLLLLPFRTVNGLGAILTIVLGLVAILVVAFQIVLMVARSGMLVILAGILPLSAAATNTEMGRAWFKRAIGWLLAFILYKPAAAIVYAAAFRLMGTDVFRDGGDGFLAVLTGMMLMVLALFALPALMRFVTPMVSGLASGAGGAAIGAAAMAALPTGASQIGGLLGKMGNSSSDAGPGPGPTDSNAGGEATGADNTGGGPTGGDQTPDSTPDNGPDGGSQTPDANGTPDGSGAASGAEATSGAAEATGAGAEAAGGAGAGAAAGAGGGGLAAAAGAAAGPIGAAAGAVGAAQKAGKAASDAAQQVGEESTGQEGPSGSR